MRSDGGRFSASAWRPCSPRDWFPPRPSPTPRTISLRPPPIEFSETVDDTDLQGSPDSGATGTEAPEVEPDQSEEPEGVASSPDEREDSTADNAEAAESPSTFSSLISYVASAFSDIAASSAAESEASPNSQAAAQAAAPAGAFTLADDYTVWGVDGDIVSPSDFSYDATAKTITVNTDERFAVQNTDQTKVETDDDAGRIANPSDICFVVPAGRKALMVLEGVGIKGTQPIDIEVGAELTLVLGDGTKNTLESTDLLKPALHCPTGSTLLIDDEVLNFDSKGTHIVPSGGELPRDCTLENGTKVSKGDPLSKLESSNPGELYATTQPYGDAAAIGGKGMNWYSNVGPIGEPAGNMTFDGGTVIASAASQEDAYYNGGAAIGGGACGSGTGPDEWITINGGRVTANGAAHGAGIGGGVYSCSGNIRINGGFVKSNGGIHSSGFGGGCSPHDSSSFQLILTGGTLIPTGTSTPGINAVDAGAPNLQAVITGASIGNASGAAGFRFSGTAKNDKGEPVRMVEVDLTADVGENAYKLSRWQLLVDGKPYDYGAPAEFDKGHLYLWLPDKIVQESEVTVDFTYVNTDKLDAAGNPTEITPLPLFRPPGTATDGKLRRYENFVLPDSYLDRLTKYYDGEPFDTYAISKDKPLPTLEEIGKDPATGKPLYRELTDGDAVTYKYQLFDKRPDGGAEPVPAGPEVDTGGDMPRDAGVMKFTMTSTEYSNTDGFKESYWGHRATGWCEIKPTTSKVAGVRAAWEDGQAGSVAEDARQRLTVSATISKGDAAPDGSPNGGACRAPRGYIQLYVDGKAVGDPVKMVFAGDVGEDGAPVAASAVNAREVPDGAGSHTEFEFAFTPADKDFLVPDATGDNRHTVSVRYLPPASGDGAPRNYLESASPADDPSVPEADVEVKPVDPNPSVALSPDPDAAPDAPEPTLTMDPAPKPTAPGDHPTGDPIYPGDKTYTGAVETVYDLPSEDDPHPGRVLLKIETDSSGSIRVESADGDVFDADFLRGEDGEPVRDADGAYTLVIDPTAVGRGDLHVVQTANGAYTGTHWDIAVTVKPNPGIAPVPAVSKSVENLTHPQGPTQPGDRLRYTVTGSNSAEGSLWTDVVLTDALPKCLELDASTLHLENAWEGIDGAPSAGDGKTEGTWALSAPGADGRRTLSVGAGAVAGGSSAVLTFECTVSEPDFASASEGDLDLANTAEADGTRPDPADPDNPMPDPDDPGKPLPVAPSPTGPVTPPGGDKVAPSDPDVRVSKAVENITSPGAKMTKVGDTLRYEIVLENRGPASSCLLGAVVSDPLPAGIEPVAGTIRMALADGTDVAVPDSAYDAGSRTVAVTAGDLWGGQRVTLTFDATVGEAALGTDAANVAFAHGTVPSEEPGDGSQPQNPEPGKPAPVPPADDDPVASSDPAVPPVVVGDDPEEGDLSISKEAENLTRSDGTTRVGDTVRYTIVLRNEGPSTSWMDAAIRDDVPEGLEPIAGSIKIALPDGTELDVPDEAYDHRTRVLAVAAGSLHGGQAVTLAFDALVTEAALTADIGNTALAYGQPPSEWDPDGEHPEPGSPFTPGEGWEEYGRTREVIESPATYPPGVTGDGGVLPAEGPVDDSATIAKTRLAQTGDALGRLAGTLAGAAAGSLLVAGALALATRRRARAPR